MSLARFEREVLGDRLGENDRIWFPRWLRRCDLGVRNGLVDGLPVNQDLFIKFSRSLLAIEALAGRRWQADRVLEFCRGVVLRGLTLNCPRLEAI